MATAGNLQDTAARDALPPEPPDTGGGGDLGTRITSLIDEVESIRDEIRPEAQTGGALGRVRTNLNPAALMTGRGSDERSRLIEDILGKLYQLQDLVSLEPAGKTGGGGSPPY